MIAFAAPLVADSPAMPRSWMKETADGKHVFVMLSPDLFRKSELAGEHHTDVPPEYTTSGLYRRGETSLPLYTIGWWAFSVDLSDDGRYAVEHGPWPSSRSELALAFYDNGVLMREYSISELILFVWPTDYSVSHFQWRRKRAFDPATNELQISTRTWTSFTFDATTGEMTSSFRGDYMLVGAILLLAGTLWFLRSRRCKRTAAK